jgi:glycosyltransferase involved in cell wall biosynthesis
MERDVTSADQRATFDPVLRRAALLGYAPARIERPHVTPRIEKPRVSVLVPCYKYGHYVRKCVASVLSQPGVAVDVLIIDDASPDDSASVVRDLAASDPRVRAICHESNKGHIATYNEGLFQLTGDYVVLLSADDLLAPGALRRATALMEAHPEVGLVYGPVSEFSDVPSVSPQAEEEAATWTIWKGRDWLLDRCHTGRNALRCPEAVMRRSVLHAVGEYDPRLPHAADFHTWLKAAGVSDVGYVGGVTQAFYRVHGTNMHTSMFDGTAPKGIIVDLEQRYECFSRALRESTNVPRSDELFDRACRSLAREALTIAVRCYEWGKADTWPVADFAAFAERVYPPAKLNALWRAYALRRMVGAGRSRRHVLFLPGEQVYKVTSNLREWRWRYAGI